MDRDDRNHPSRQGCLPQGGSEESRRRNRGFDVQEADMRPFQRGSAGKRRRCPIAIQTPRGRSDEPARRSQVLPEEISVLVRHTGLPQQQCRGTGAEKSAEAIVAQPGEGLNLLMQGADGRFRWTRSSRKDHLTTVTAKRAEPNSRRMDSSKRSRYSTSHEP